MPVAHKWAADAMAHIKLLRSNRMSNTEIAHEFSVSTRALYEFMARHDVDRDAPVFVSECGPPELIPAEDVARYAHENGLPRRLRAVNDFRRQRGLVEWQIKQKVSA